MKDVAPNTPVIVGVGFAQERIDDPTTSAEAYRLMIAAVADAARDAGCAALCEKLESVSVTQGLWQYRNPGKLVAEALGSPTAKSIVADLGVLQIGLLSELCRAIAAGEQHIGVVTGGEAKYRALRSQITQQPVTDAQEPEDTPAPDVRHSSPDAFCSDLEAQRGFSSATDFFAVIESSLRHEQGLGIDEHRDEIARLYSRFSEIAAANPHAWNRDALGPEQIRNPTAKNAMQSFPYTKLHCSQWNVNQAVAILVCSAAKAEELGLDRAGWIYPLAQVESKHVVVLAQQHSLHSHPGTVLCGERALALAGVSANDLAAVELYSCFPAAVRSFAHDLKLDTKRDLSVTGAMPFAGGPFNHAGLEGVARMVEVLRSQSEGEAGARRVGLVANLSGIFGKQACALFSNASSEGGYAYEDVTATAARRDPPLPLDADYAGPATIVGYTVVYRAGEMSYGIAICDTPGGARTVIRIDDASLLAAMTQEEFCGRTVEVLSDGCCRAA